MKKTRKERLQEGSRQRREQEKAELRQIIITSASQMFVERGYDGFSMRQLAENIGYAVATLYLYFQDKDDLLFTVVDEGFARFARQLTQAAASTAEPWPRLNAIGQAYIEFGLNNPNYYQLMFMWRTDYLAQSRPGEHRPRVEAFGVLYDAVEDAIAKGVMNNGNVQDISYTFWITLHGLVAMKITLPTFTPDRVESVAALLNEMLFKMFAR